MPIRLSTWLLAALRVVVASPLLGQATTPGVDVEVSAGMIFPTRNLKPRQRLKSAPFAGLGLVLRTPTRVSFRVRAVVGLTKGTAIGPASSTVEYSEGRILAGVADVLVSVGRTGAIELGLGAGRPEV